ncbi:MAG: ABC transporter substrate-binding protein [Sphaerochaetaceae bacterium]|nr:ABC transporter substrate-binding protein [Sphaerochaetaceae bacterium]MDC7238292.1 ABC transporter substrate-binding protein [Sphaerochaetaceae bacterium]MDC7242862.1 ABC transporter substrate-binding protein [Sphaerochaetaceae bacterium]MDC7249231.1 ABC transporter substrate-binding protein [Sphaerochaetaceae bacterium]
MKWVKLVLVAIQLLLSAAIFASGVNEESVLNSNNKVINNNVVTVVDVLDRQVSIELPVERVAFTHYSTAEALKLIDAWSVAVARDGYTNEKVLYPNIDEIPALTPIMGSSYEPNMEVLLEINPDVLILEVIPMPGIEDLINKLEGIIPVIAVKTYDPEKMVQSFEILGKILNKEEEASKYINWCIDIQNYLIDKVSTLKEDELTRIFYKTGYGGVEDLMTFTNELSYIPVRNKLTGCINVAADLDSQGGWVPSLDSEWLVQQEYDVLIIGDPQPNGFGFYKDSIEELDEYRNQVMKLPVFADSTAVKNDRVYMQYESYFGSPSFIIGFAYMAKWFHPQLFSDFDPSSLQKEYFQEFMNVDPIDIENGIFVYPEE